MTIDFHDVTPAPIAGNIDSGTEIWQKSFGFETGKRYCLVAPSGKGKTTFIHLIYGLRADYEGAVSIGGSEARSISDNHWARLRRDSFSIVYQDLRLFLQLSARENILAKAALYRQDVSHKIDEIAAALGIAHLLDKPARTLSFGERQRVAIVRALIAPFEWLLLDEPFSHLDEENQQKAALLIEREVEARKAGVLLTSLRADVALGCDVSLRL